MDYQKKERTTRSNSYQFVLLEQAFAPEMLAEVADSEGIFAQLNPFGYNETILELKDQLKIEFWRLVEEKLTPRQREVIKLYCEGLTQMEIAKKLNVNQSSITKSLNGNCDYRNGRRLYGGSRKKLQKLAEQDPKIQAIIEKIQELSDGF
jgi:RNA polymerase sigma factor (sigma-70 family)